MNMEFDEAVDRTLDEKKRVMQRSDTWARSAERLKNFTTPLCSSCLAILVFSLEFAVAAEACESVLRSASAPTELGQRGALGGSDFNPEAAFDQMKMALVGEWRGRFVEIDSPVEARYYLAGNGSALVEDMSRPDKPDSRMHTVYHLADEELRLTHYCSFRNQPRLVASSVRSDDRTIEFELVDVTNLSRSGNRYTHKMVVSLLEDGRASITYIGLDEGVEGSLTAQLKRVRR